jgi:hypothetical protein
MVPQILSKTNIVLLHAHQVVFALKTALGAEGPPRVKLGPRTATERDPFTSS